MRLMLMTLIVTVLAGARADALVLCTKGKSGNPKEGAPIKVRTACTGKEVALDPDALGLRGPAGPPGAAGTNGTDGAPGADGAPGFADIEFLTTPGNTVPSATLAVSAINVQCTGGKSILGGGYAYGTGGGSFTTPPRNVVSRPIYTEPQGWAVSAEAVASGNWQIIGYAICADAGVVVPPEP